MPNTIKIKTSIEKCIFHTTDSKWGGINLCAVKLHERTFTNEENRCITHPSNDKCECPLKGKEFRIVI
jgi:hypothetical protein